MTAIEQIEALATVWQELANALFGGATPRRYDQALRDCSAELRALAASLREQESEDRRDAERLMRIEAWLHSRMMHPDYEYDITDGPRKNFDERAPEGDGWERNVEQGRDGWERFDYHEEAYWRRLRIQPSNTIDAALRDSKEPTK